MRVWRIHIDLQHGSQYMLHIPTKNPISQLHGAKGKMQMTLFQASCTNRSTIWCHIPQRTRPPYERSYFINCVICHLSFIVINQENCPPCGGEWLHRVPGSTVPHSLFVGHILMDIQYVARAPTFARLCMNAIKHEVHCFLFSPYALHFNAPPKRA